MLSITNFNYLLTATIFALICFSHVFSLAFLLLLNFLFARGYYISTRVEIFHVNAVFFNSVYRVEISTGDENLHIISPLDMDNLLGKTLGKHESNFKNLNILNFNVLNEKFDKLKLTTMTYSHFIFNFLLFQHIALKT